MSRNPAIPLSPSSADPIGCVHHPQTGEGRSHVLSSRVRAGHPESPGSKFPRLSVRRSGASSVPSVTHQSPFRQHDPQPRTPVVVRGTRKHQSPFRRHSPQPRTPVALRGTRKYQSLFRRHSPKPHTPVVVRGTLKHHLPEYPQRTWHETYRTLYQSDQRPPGTQYL